MKRFLALLLVLCMVLSLAACGDPGKNDAPNYSDDEDETTEPTQAEADLSDVPNPLVNCPSLQYLYLARCTNIKDISALATSTTLKIINIYGIEGLGTSAFYGTEIEIRDYY